MQKYEMLGEYANTTEIKLMAGVNMTGIKLNEIPKSKEFIKHAGIAVDLTKQTGLEHGFTFCSHNGGLIVDKMCIGTECSIDITSAKCDEHDNFFHVHPGRDFSNFSVGDKYSNVYRAYKSGRPIVSCLQAEHSDDIKCEMANPVSYERMKSLSDEYDAIRETALRESLTPDEEHILDDFESFLDSVSTPLQIVFNTKTGEVSSYHYID